MQQTKQAAFKQYVLAGNRMVAHERISVSSNVYVDNAGEQDARNCYKAPACAGKPRGIPFRWAAITLALAAFIALFMVGTKTTLTRQLVEEYSHLQDRLQAAEADRLELLEEINALNDSSDISYYAVQNLGMRLATHAETIGVQAFRLPEGEGALRGSASGAQ
jgi:cell division protein FtsL